MKSRFCIALVVMSFGLISCHSHEYTSHTFLVVDQSTREPINGAKLAVNYDPLRCGTPFGDLLGDPRPNTRAKSTDERGQANMRLATGWRGFIVVIEAPSYQRLEIHVNQDTGDKAIPDRIELTPVVSRP